MNYPYSVKVNGKWYRPNTEIPEQKEKSTVSKKESVKETDKK